MSVAVLRLPQERLWGRLRFAAATLFGACFGVRDAFFLTRPAWLDVEDAAM